MLPNPTNKHKPVKVKRASSHKKRPKSSSLSSMEEMKEILTKRVLERTKKKLDGIFTKIVFRTHYKRRVDNQTI